MHPAFRTGGEFVHAGELAIGREVVLQAAPEMIDRVELGMLARQSEQADAEPLG